MVRAALLGSVEGEAVRLGAVADCSGPRGVGLFAVAVILAILLSCVPAMALAQVRPPAVEPTASGSPTPGSPAGPSGAASPALRIPAAGAAPVPTRALPGTGLPDLPALSSQRLPPHAAPASGPAGASGGAADSRHLPPAGTASGTGVTQSFQDLKLSLTAAGRIEGLMVKEGERVRRGDLLLHLDRSLEALEIRRRQVMLEDNARLEELRSKERTLTEQVGSARFLLASGGVSRKQVEDEELALGAIIAERKTLEFAKRREQVELELAREAYERRHLRSPIDGVITRIIARVGESVAPHEPVITLVDVRTVRFTATVPIAEAARMRSGAPVRVVLGTEAEPLIRQAQVVFVSPIADPASGLVEVIAEFANADGSVWPGTAGRLMAVSPAPRGR